MRGLVQRNFQTLTEQLPSLPDDEKQRATDILAAEKEIILEKAFETRRNGEHGVKSESYRLKHCF